MNGKEDMIETFVVIDDIPYWTDQMRPNVVVTKAPEGITDDLIDEAVAILLKEVRGS
jgi:hypothetical protein